MPNEQTKNWWMLLVKGIIFIVLAIFIFGHPVEALIGLGIYIGIALLFTGLILIFISVSARKSMDSWGWKFAAGVLDVLLGFMLLAHPGVTAVVLPFIIGFWVMFYGIILLTDAFGLKKAGLKVWTYQLFTGILTIILGYLITFNPFAGALTITMMIAIPLMLFGIFNVVSAFSLKSHA